MQNAMRRGATWSRPFRKAREISSIVVIGRFDRELALKLAEVPPTIERAGELLDSLIGPLG
jgi:hypothetical protein